MQSATNIVAVPAFDPDTTGVISYWSLPGGSCDRPMLVAALGAAGFCDERDLPPLPTPKVAFYRAVNAMTTGTRFMRKSKQQAVYYLCVLNESGDGLELTKNLRVYLDSEGCVESDGDDPEGLTERVTEEYMRQLTTLTSTDVSAWLVRQADKCQAVSLRPTGGFYFVPKNYVDRWRAITAALLASAPLYNVFEIPALATDDTVEAVLDAVLREAKATADKIAGVLKDNTVGPRAYKSRAAEAELMAQKVEQYEELLGRKIEDYREQLEQLSAQAVHASLKGDED